MIYLPALEEYVVNNITAILTIATYATPSMSTAFENQRTDV